MFQNWLVQGLKYLVTLITFQKETTEKFLPPFFSKLQKIWKNCEGGTIGHEN